MARKKAVVTEIVTVHDDGEVVKQPIDPSGEDAPQADEVMYTCYDAADKRLGYDERRAVVKCRLDEVKRYTAGMSLPIVCRFDELLDRVSRGLPNV